MPNKNQKYILVSSDLKKDQNKTLIALVDDSLKNKIKTNKISNDNN